MLFTELQRQKETLNTLLKEFRNRDTVNTAKIEELEKHINTLLKEKANLAMDLVRVKSINNVVCRSIILVG